jgi:hypothetical protein
VRKGIESVRYTKVTARFNHSIIAARKKQSQLR